MRNRKLRAGAIASALLIFAVLTDPSALAAAAAALGVQILVCLALASRERASPDESIEVLGKREDLDLEALIESILSDRHDRETEVQDREMEVQK